MGTNNISELENKLKLTLQRLEYPKTQTALEIFSRQKNSYVMDDHGNVLMLNLSSNDIQDIIFLSEFPSITNLILDNNKINDITSLEKLRNLLVLSLERNELSDISILARLQSIEYLDLSYNNIPNFPTIKKSSLRTLILAYNRIKDFDGFSSLKNLRALDLQANNLENIDMLEFLTNIEHLNFSQNSISDIRSLSQLYQLKSIDFSQNNILDISPIKYLANLKSILFGDNQIFDLTPIYFLLKNDPAIDYNFFDNPLVYPPFDIYLRGHLFDWFDLMNENTNEIIKRCIDEQWTVLDLGNCGITDISILEKIYDCQYVEELILSNEWAESAGEDWVKMYSKNKGNFKNNLFEIPNDIGKLKNLRKLIIGGDWNNQNSKTNRWRIKDISFIKTLKNIEVINASNNQIEVVKIPRTLSNLTELYLNNNKIKHVENVTQLQKLRVLNISNNNLSSLAFLKMSVSLEILDLHSNDLLSIDDLLPLSSTATKINVFNNPFTYNEQWKLAKYENHIGIIKNYLSLKDVGQYDYKLPVKVLFLGNHQAGKSTLLDYLTTNRRGRKIIPTSDSTHIVRIQTFPKKRSNNTLPEVIYFDFGGQDYYHGIYKAFLTNDAINVVLWNKNSNENQIRTDTNNLLTRDFKLDYWLFQLKYYYNDISKKNRNVIIDVTDGKKQREDVVFLCQTYADSFEKESFNQEIDYINILNEFYISLDEKQVKENNILRINLDYLENTLKYSIDEKREQPRYTVKRPIWFGTFLTFILNYKSYKSLLVTDLRKEYGRVPNVGETEENILEFLKVDLDQLHRQGIVLYYKDNVELNNVVWLNPGAVINFIHDKILSRKLLKNGIVRSDAFAKSVRDLNLLQLLKLQNVIFEDLNYSRYIIPSFLPLSHDKSTRDEYSLLTFGLNNPSYTLKFLKFIPFGIVNQLICNFGNERDSKYFWRDQLIFTLNGSTKILIKLDFSNLEIKVYFNFEKVTNYVRKLTQKYIFNCLIAIYHDLPILTIEEYLKECTIISVDETAILGRSSKVVNFIDSIDNLPDDLYISVDDISFVKASEISSSDLRILSYYLNKTTEDTALDDDLEKQVRSINFSLHKEIPNYIFQNFTHKILNKMKKIFISYSRKDVEFKNELKKHLNILKTFDIADNWSCEEITIGKWDAQIQKELEESDLIIYMLSANFFSSKYILEQEVQKGMDLINVNPNKNILCVVVSNFTGLDKLKNGSTDSSPLRDSLLKLTEYQYLPYGNVKNNVTNQDEEKIIPLKDYARIYNIETALEQITSKILEVVR